MQVNNSILKALELDTEEFLYNTHVTLYQKNDRTPFGQVSCDDGHYKLTVGYVDQVKGTRCVIK